MCDSGYAGAQQLEACVGRFAFPAATLYLTQAAPAAASAAASKTGIGADQQQPSSRKCCS